MHSIHRLLIPVSHLQYSSIKEIVDMALEPYGNDIAYDYYYFEDEAPIYGASNPNEFEKEIIFLRDYQRNRVKALTEYLSEECNITTENFFQELANFDKKSVMCGLCSYYLYLISSFRQGFYNFESCFYNCDELTASILYDEDVDYILDNCKDYVIVFVNLHI